ncbi:hypothetical protein [Nonlabens xiamenensis]|uniref:hypothetical protein n=1 Tax=Nonlabens xiamenensis TaxID=2341043 RepID=UPI000F61474B|nr:hypothetical protein [Nonlabens xiamenensis]
MRRIGCLLFFITLSICQAQTPDRPTFDQMLQQSKDLTALRDKYASKAEIRQDLNILMQIDAGFSEEELKLLKSLYSFLENPYSCEPVYDISAAVNIIGDGSQKLTDMMDTQAESQLNVQAVLQPLSFEIANNVDEEAPINFDTSSTGLFGNGDSTAFADALSRFLVDRVKQEIIIEFYNVFRRELDREYQLIPLKNDLQQSKSKAKAGNGNTNDVEDAGYVTVTLAELFPQTASLFNYQDIYTAPSNGKVWGAAYKSDLEQLPSNFVQLLINHPALQNQEFVQLLKVSQELLPLFEGGLTLQEADQLILGILSLKPEFEEVAAIYKLYRFWMTELGGDTFNFDDYESLSEREKQYFSGLMFQQLIHIPELEDLKADCNVGKIKNLVAGFKSFRTSFQLMDERMKFIAADGFPSMGYRQYLVVSDIGFAAATELAQRCQEAEAGTDLISAFTKSRVSLDFMVNLPENNTAQNLLGLIQLNESLQIFPTGSKFFKNLVFYSNFLIDLESAASEGDVDQMEAVLQRYALPVGSFRMKRGASYSIDINAYPGVMGSLETNAGNALTAGITAPLGIAFSINHPGEEEKNSGASSSLFLSVIDLGAPFAYRFTNDSSEGLPQEITWKQLFAPGVAYIYGFKNTPVSLMAGVQWAPELRSFDQENGSAKNIFRVNLGITVDIPLFNLLISDSHNESDLYKDARNQVENE